MIERIGRGLFLRWRLDRPNAYDGLKAKVGHQPFDRQTAAAKPSLGVQRQAFHAK